MATKPTITIDLDLRCPRCRKPGAVRGPDGVANPCLTCVLKAMTDLRRKGKR